MTSEEKRKKILYSVISAVCMLILIVVVYRFSVPNPNMILITALVLFTGLGGLVPGAISAVLMALYSMFFFSTDHNMVSYTDVNLQKVLIVFCGIVLNFLVVGLLKRREDRARKQLERANRDLSEANAVLQEEADAAAKIAELTQSMSSLRTNMPTLTFSKDVKTGKYLACNQLFAEYADKSAPAEVVGLTDHEMFDAKTADHFAEDDRKAMSMDGKYVFYEDVPDAKGEMRHFQTTKLKFTDSQGRECLLGMSVDVSEVVEMKELTREVTRKYEKARDERVTYAHIAQALASDYSYLYYVNIRNDHFIEFIPDHSNNTLTVAREEENFFAQSQEDAMHLLDERDREGFRAVFTKENVLKALDDQGSFDTTYRLLIDGVPNYMSMKGSRMEDDNDHIVIGVKNVDVQMKAIEAAERMKEDQITYTRISALAGNYLVIYTVDPATDHYTEYSAMDSYNSLEIGKEGDDFFQQARKNAKEIVLPEDLEHFETLFTKENVMKEIEVDGDFSIRYRIMMNGEPVNVRLKAVRINEKDGVKILVGLRNINAQVKREEEYEYNLAAAQRKATRDALTGVKNKHAYDEAEKELNEQIANGEHPEFAIVMFDVNDLKLINDTQGHHAWDEHMRKACSVICNIFKHSPVYRVGGDEFCVIAKGHDYEMADLLVDLVDTYNHGEGKETGVVVACGLARYEGEGTASSVYEHADRVMYENKLKLKAEGLTTIRGVE